MPTRPSSFALLLVMASCGPNQTHPVYGDYVGPQEQPLPCVPNLDGKIDANELQAAVGVAETLLVSPVGVTRAVNLDGTTNAAGNRIWDFSALDPDDQQATIEAQALSTRWYAASFPGGQFAAPLDAADTLEGIYTHDDTAVSLLGIASAQMNPSQGQTLWVYDQPVAIFRFPITPGASWTSTGTVRNGVVEGLPYAGIDTYQVNVVASGQLLLPDFTFQQAMEVRTTLTTQPAVGATVVNQQASFLFECFGEVARATAAPGETNSDFTTAAELRRLSLKRSKP